MKYLSLLVIALLTISFSEVNAQTDVKLNKSEFKVGKEGFNEAWNFIKAGDGNYIKGGGLYELALLDYKEAFKYNKESAVLNYKMGVCELFGNHPENALPYFLSSYDLNPDIVDDLLLLTGMAYQVKGDYGKAIDCYNMYSDKNLQLKSFRTEVNDYINQCNNAIDMAGMKRDAEIINLGNRINSAGDDYSALVSENGNILYFTSRRNPGGKVKRQVADMKWGENIFVSMWEDDEWTEAIAAGKYLATEMNEGALHLNRTSDIMWVYAGWSANGDIYVTEYVKGKWTEPEPVKASVNGPSRETSFAITDDGEEIFFTSDRKKGGLGGRDIYYIKRVKKNKWTKPYNLGPLVNSPKNEEAVWISPLGDSLWYSSNGHKGMGGYDVFLSVRDEIGVWSEPKNQGIPINSQGNDLFYKPSLSDKDVAFFSSDRPGGKGGLDIYKIFFTEPDTVKMDLVKADTIKPVMEIPDTLRMPSLLRY